MRAAGETLQKIQRPRKRVRLLQRLLSRKTTVAGIIILALLILCTAVGSILAPFTPDAQGDLLLERNLPPDGNHLFGTDKFARDVFSRVMFGGRISLSIALVVVGLSLTIGVAYGLVSGYFGGWVDAFMMRLLDFCLAFPVIFVVLVVVALYQPGHWYLIPLLALTSWMDTARLIRSEVLSVKEREFILAAKGMGFSDVRIMLRHVLPNCLNPAWISAPLKVGEIILLESALSFLGFGVQPPTASWGSIINDGRQALGEAWWVSAFPGIFISLTVMSLNLIGDGLRHALNPRERS